MTSLVALLDRRALRVPLLVGTVVATVATSGPSWDLSESTEARPVHLDAGASTETNLELDASHAVFVAVALDGLDAREGTLSIVAVDSRPECAKSEMKFVSDDGIWRLSKPPGEPTPGSKLHHIDFRPLCVPTQSKATVTMRFVNEGQTPLDFDWKATASIGGDESDDPPDGAFVHVKVQE